MREHALFMLNPEGRIASWNAAAERIFGYSAEEAIGRSLFEFIKAAGDSSDQWPQLIEGTGNARQAWEGWCGQKSGTQVWCELVVSAFDGPDGVPGGYSCVIRDLTEQRRAQAELRDSEERFRQLAENIQEVFWMYEPHTPRIVYVSPAYERVWGRSRESLYREPGAFHDAVVPEDRELIASAHERQLRGEETELEYRIVVPNGDIRWIRDRAFPVRDGSPEVRRIAGVAEDITERRAAAVALRESQQALRALLQSSPLAIIGYDRELRIQFWNPAAERMFGWTEREVAGRLSPTVPEELREEFHERSGMALRGEEPPAFETRRVSKDGIEIDVQILTAALRGTDGNINGIMSVVVDIRERRRIEQERSCLLQREQEARAQAERSRARIQLLAEASTLLSSSLDYQTTLNRVAELVVPRLADWCIVDLEQQGVIQRIAVVHRDPGRRELAEQLKRLYPPEPSAPRLVANVLRTAQSELYSDFSDALLVESSRDSKHLELLRGLGLKSVMCVPLKLQERTLGVLSLISEDSRHLYETDDLAFAEELAVRCATAVENARLYRDAMEASRLKDEFLAIVSHELRTPLTSILGWAKYLTPQNLQKPVALRAIESILRNAEAQAQIVDDLLDMSRIISGKLPLQLRPIELPSIIQTAIESVRPAANAKGIRVETSSTPTTEMMAGDPTRLQQILWNLLANAIKFTPEGGRIQVALTRAGSTVELSVSDTGAGISRDFLPYVFDRFRQENGPYSRQHGGLGLGLAIARHLVELHGGTISAESEGEGKGARFTVRFPVLPPAVTNPLQQPASEGAVAAAPSLDGLRVLIVDDELDAREMLSTVLSSGGADVRSAGSVSEAMAALSSWMPDVLLLDMGMPSESGLDLIQRVRQHESALSLVPAVALTAFAGSEDRTQALSSGFQMHIPKPVEPERRLAIVAQVAAERPGNDAVPSLPS